MGKDSAITIRVPASLKKRLERRAHRQRRSLSAQVTFDLEQLVALDAEARDGGAFLGKYEGARLPTEQSIQEVRSLMWGRLEGA